RGEEDLPRAEPLRLLGPRQRVDAGGDATAVHEDLKAHVGAAGVDGDDHALGAELGGDLPDELGAVDGGAVDGHLVGPGPQELAGVLDRPDPSADGEG